MIPARVKIQRLTPTAKLPARATEGAAGFDVYCSGKFEIWPNETVSVSTDILIEVPKGYEAQVRSRSGLSIQGVIVVNSPGTIDSDYRGELRVLLKNIGSYRKTFEHGERVAQLVFQKLPDVVIEEAPIDESSSARGSGGFGSTGK